MDLIAFDVLCRPGSRVRLRVRLERADIFRRGVTGRPILFRRLPVPGLPGSPGRAPTFPAGEPRGPASGGGMHDLGELRTDRWGCAELPFAPTGPGHHFFEVESVPHHGEPSAWTTGLVAVRDDRRPAVALDIDGTLTAEATTLRTGAAGAMLKDVFALAAVHQLAQEYDPLYLTGRRRQLVNQTRDWLIRQGLPVGPLFAQMTFFPVPGILSGWWKGARLASLRARHPNLVVGIGNTGADAGAYARNGLLPLIFSERRRRLNAVRVESWDEVDLLLLGERLALREPARVVLGVRTVRVLELSSEGSGARVSLTGADGTDWRPPAAPWPVLRAELWRRLRARPGQEPVPPDTPSHDGVPVLRLP